MRPSKPGEGGDAGELPADEQGRAQVRLLALPHGLLLPLAYGELSEQDARELFHLKQTIHELFGFDCMAYKEPCLRRRLAVRMRARGLHTYTAYRALLEQDAAEGSQLLDAITINVSKFYRNPEIWATVETLVLPRLFALSAPRVRIWSAGCAGGEEPFTMAMVLLQYAERHGLLGQLRRFDILGTDVDRAALEQCARADYTSFAFSEIDPQIRQRFFEGNRLQAQIRSMVRFQDLDLMRGEFPRGQHLLLCRNVIIYFERKVQENLFLSFHSALEREGTLVLGKVETIFGKATGLFRPLASRERVFCRA